MECPSEKNMSVCVCVCRLTAWQRGVTITTRHLTETAGSSGGVAAPLAHSLHTHQLQPLLPTQTPQHANQRPRPRGLPRELE